MINKYMAELVRVQEIKEKLKEYEETLKKAIKEAVSD